MSKNLVTSNNAIEQREEQSGELMTRQSVAAVQAEIQGAIVLAKQFPRNEEQAFTALSISCNRLSFAEEVEYSFPRGKRKDENGNWVDNYITGPSIYLAREAARLWKNVRHGVDILRDDDSSRQIRCWTWDVEANVKCELTDEFEKLIQRKVRGETIWIKPDERDLRELTNKRAAIAKRNTIFEILPKDYVEMAREAAQKTIRRGIDDDPESARKKVIIAFGVYGINGQMLEEFLKHPLATLSPVEIQTLRQMYNAIKDGQASWFDYIKPAEAAPETGTININSVTPGKEENRGHGKDNLDQAAKVSEPEAPQPAVEQPKSEEPRQSACSDELYNQLVDTIENAKAVGVTQAKINSTIKIFTGPNRSKEDLKDDEVSALIKQIADTAAKVGK